MLVHQIVAVVLSYMVFAASVLVVARIARSSEARFDEQRRIYLARRITLLITGIIQLLGTACAVVIGVAFLDEGWVMGWGIFALAGVPLVFLALTVLLARMPFDYPDDL